MGTRRASPRLIRRKCKEQLQRGDWLGTGATAFYAEMNSSVLPAMKRLVVALRQAVQTVKAIDELVQQAEQDAARALTYADTVHKPVPTHNSGKPENSPDTTTRLLSALDVMGQIDNVMDVAGTLTTILALKEWATRLETLEPLLKYYKVINPYLLTPIRELEQLYKTQKQMIGVFDVLPAPWRRLEALFDSLPVKGFGQGLNVVSLAVNAGKIFLDIKQKNYLDLVEHGADAVIDVVDIVATSTGNPILGALAGGYALGKIFDSATGYSDKISDALAGNEDKWSGRDYVDDFVQGHASPEERKAYFDWRRDWRAKVIDAEKTGAPAPPYDPPPLEVFRKLDPWVKARARKNESITSGSLAVRNLEKEMAHALPGAQVDLFPDSPII